MIKVKYKKRGRPKKEIAKAKQALEKMVNDPKFAKYLEDLYIESIVFGFVTQERMDMLKKRHGIFE